MIILEIGVNRLDRGVCVAAATAFWTLIAITRSLSRANDLRCVSTSEASRQRVYSLRHRR